MKKLNLKLNVVIFNVLDENKKLAADSLAILAELKNLNIGLNPIGVSFDICEFARIDKSDKDVPDSIFNNVRYLFSSYKRPNTINIFFVQDISEKTHKCSYNLGNIDKDGLSGIFFSCLNKGDVLHEIGHVFGLTDTFGNGKELAEGSNCATQGDLICDTPADPFKEGSDTSDFVSKDCNFHYKEKDAKSSYYQPLVSNPMGPYSSCRCPSFTRMQYNKMLTIIKKPSIW